jgi:hypothetical protein
MCLMKPVSGVLFRCWVLFETTESTFKYNLIQYVLWRSWRRNSKQSCMLNSYFELTKCITRDRLSISGISYQLSKMILVNWSMPTPSRQTRWKMSVKCNTEWRSIVCILDSSTFSIKSNPLGRYLYCVQLWTRYSVCGDRESIVGIATNSGLDGPGFEIPGEAIFSPRPTQPPIANSLDLYIRLPLWHAWANFVAYTVIRVRY